MKAKSYAKINLSLDILNKREDNYHNIETIMQKINIYDEIEFIKKDSGFELITDEQFNVELEDNLIYKAWKLLCDYTGRDLGIKIILNKKLPIAAGIAGGTGNGAVTLKALNKLYDLSLSEKLLMDISLKIGADFPYMISGGTKLAQGIGEILTPLDDFNGIDVILVNPGYGISTKEVYENLRITDKKMDTEKIIEAMKKRSFESLQDLLYNKMEESVFIKHPDIKYIKDKIRSFGGISLMSGSGASVFGLFSNKESIEKCYEYFAPKYSMTYKTHTIGGYDEF